MLLLWVSIGIKAKNPAVVQWRSDDRMVAYVRLCHGHACLFQRTVTDFQRKPERKWYDLYSTICTEQYTLRHFSSILWALYNV